MKVIWAPLAVSRARQAVDYIAADRPQAAAAWLEELIERVESLGRFPRRGHPVAEIDDPAYRCLLHEPYRIIYRVDSAHVVILTVRHVRRKWDPDEVAPDDR